MVANLANVPSALQGRPQWIVWKTIQRDGGPTKVPFQITGKPAKSNDPTTWSTFDEAVAAFKQGGYDGVGFMFSADDDFCGIDLDGARDPETGKIEQWAKDIIIEFDTYAEVSPSQTGAKLFILGKLPFGGRKHDLADVEKIGDKQPGIEVYDRLRYFAVTGLRLTGPAEPQQRQELLTTLCERHWPEQHATVPAADFSSPDAVVDRARKYLAKVPPAVTGSSGHNATFHAACILVCGFALTSEQATQVLAEWNQTCQPPWSEKDLAHKVDGAFRQSGDRGYLRNTNPHQWDRVTVPKYEAPPESKPGESTTLGEAADKYIAELKAGKTNLTRMGLPGLDDAIGGGVADGEMVIIAARPSHGKSMVGLQCVHNWTEAGMAVLFITEEMSPLALGKRTLQYTSEIPEEDWRSSLENLTRDAANYRAVRETCHVVANCGTVEKAVDEIRKAVHDKNVTAVVIDYAQLLQSKGNGRYEQVTKTSEALRRVSNETGVILLVLCQLNRQIESRKTFVPMMSDIKETGQFEQDADVIIFTVWPHRINPALDAHEFKLYIAKNRNRPIVSPVVTCRIEPSRQTLTKQKADISWKNNVDGKLKAYGDEADLFNQATPGNEGF